MARTKRATRRKPVWVHGHWRKVTKHKGISVSPYFRKRRKK